MSHPPEYPGSRRLKRAATRTGGGAYEGAFEAVGAIGISIGIGAWVDSEYETAPTGVLVGAVIGFAAFVLRLIRLGKKLHPDAGAEGEAAQDAAPLGPEIDDELGVGEAPGVSDVLRESKPEAQRAEETGEETGEETREKKRQQKREEKRD